MIQLSDHFTYGRLFRFTFPSIVMLIFTSIYGVVDGFFVSNFVGKTPFAAVNLIMPALMILDCIGFMFGTGGAALISRTMGEGDLKKANEIFSMIVWVSTICGIVIGVLGFIFLPQIAGLLGAEGELLKNCVLYGRIILAAQPFYILQFEFQCLFATAEKPKLGLYVTVAAGMTNMLLDALFVAVFSWGLAGAAAATALSQFVGGVIPLAYFLRKDPGKLRLGRWTFDGKALLKTCTNGSSEFMSNVSISLVSMLYNLQLMKYAGENGIAAYGVLMYVSLILILSCSLLMFAAGELLAAPLSRLFVGYDTELLEITSRAFMFFSVSFLFSGFSIYCSSFFTALSDGLTSALLSFLRTLVFQVAAVLLLPLIWKLDGIWLSIVVAEALAVIVTILFLLGKRKRYGY